jgi:2-phosphosulfolactate phosphatase
VNVNLRAHFLPALVAPEDLAGAAVVVIDVLRATTVIAHSLAAGAREVIPCLEVDDARRAAARLPSGQAVLGGERGGLKIEGFDLGNSPEEYTTESVGGKTVVFTTTNGTRAMLHCRTARRVYLGAFVNAAAVVEALAAEDEVHLLCAGTREEVTREDVLLAGLIADELIRRAKSQAVSEINDQALIARDCWQAFAKGRHRENMAGALSATLRSTQGGRNLQQIGLEHDIDVAARIDRFSLVPQLDVAAWRIR